MAGLVRSTGETLRAAAAIGLVIVLVYGDLCFLGYTLSPAVYMHGVLSVAQYGYRGRWIYYYPVMDPLATGGQNWPIYELISKALRAGDLPLWNPYQGVGAPLAADTSWSTYFPIDLLYLVLPNQYWDFVWLLKLWAAGFLCYLLLRELGLSQVPAIGGGFAYSLSGAFIFNPFMPWTNVAVLTPALLLVVKRCFDRPFGRDSVALGSIIFAVSLLGAHIEALVIQFLFVNLFVVFEAIARKKESIHAIATWMIVVLSGLGLAAFYLLPVFEYLGEATLAHGGGAGLHSLATFGNPAISWLSLFVPYFYGFIQTYPYEGLIRVFSWDMSPGYLGTTVFFLSLLPLLSLRSSWRSDKTRYFLFFLIAEILVLMKIFGVPPVNWIGSLPVLTYVVFSRYSGSVLAMSFAGACAFGLERALTQAPRSSLKASLAVLIALVPALYATIPFPASPSNPFFLVSSTYLGLSIVFLVLSSWMAGKGGVIASKVLVSFIILELASYIPRSLSIEYEVLRLVTLAGAAAIVVVYATGFGRPLQHLALPTPRSSLPLAALSGKHLLATVLVAALVLQFVISGSSPYGLPNRYDAFTEAPYVRFLQANTGYQRVYSLDGVFFPPVAGVFSIQSLGEFSAFMPSSFRTFSRVNLDRGAIWSMLVGNAWERIQSISPSTEIRDNLEFYSLLGVKYFVTAYTRLGILHEVMLEPETKENQSWTPLGNESVSTQFVTDISFNCMTIGLGTYDRINSGRIVLVLDSVPTNSTFHRESSINAEYIINGARNLFCFTEVRLNKRTELRVTLSQSDTRAGNEIAVMWWAQVRQNDHLAISSNFMNIALGVSLHDESFPVVYHDENVSIYENLRAFPRAFLVNQAVLANDQEEAVQRTAELRWATRDTAVLEGAPSTQLDLIGHWKGESGLGSAEIEGYSPSEVAIRIKAYAPSILVLSDAFYPGWRVYLNGKPGLSTEPTAWSEEFLSCRALTKWFLDTSPTPSDWASVLLQCLHWSSQCCWPSGFDLLRYARRNLDHTFAVFFFGECMAEVTYNIAELEGTEFSGVVGLRISPGERSRPTRTVGRTYCRSSNSICAKVSAKHVAITTVAAGEFLTPNAQPIVPP